MIKSYKDLTYVVILVKGLDGGDTMSYKVNFGESWEPDEEDMKKEDPYKALNRPKQHWIETYHGPSALGWMVLDKEVLEG